MRSHLTFANVMSCLALFVALGGTSYAAVSITGRNVKNSSLTGADIRNGSVGTSDVKDGGLLARDFKRGQLPAGARGATGAQGPAGAQGTPGAQGPAGPTYFAQVDRDGVLKSGTASSATQNAVGDYTVAFARDVSSCAASASAALFPGSSGANSQTSSIVSMADNGPGDIRVRFTDASDGNFTPAQVNTAFALVVACP